MNTTTKFFDTKEQYLAFRQAFAAAHNDKRARSYFVEATTNIRDPQTKRYSQVAIKVKTCGWLQSEHFLFLNLVRGKAFYAGFSPKAQRSFLNSGGDPDQALDNAIRKLKAVVNEANFFLDNKPTDIPSWRQKDKEEYVNEVVRRLLKEITDFLEPFAGTVTIPQLANLKLPTVSFKSKTDILNAGGAVKYADIIEDHDAIVSQTPAPPREIPTVVIPVKVAVSDLPTPVEETKAKLSFFAKVKKAVGV